MATFSVAADGKRIKTDVLVAGYIRNLSKKYEFLIPGDINGICFKYWLITVCDEWDKELSSDRAEINNQTITSKVTEFASMYGCLGIDKGSYEWQIKLKSYVTWFAMGIIEDDEEILTKYKDDYKWIMNNGCCINEGGHFYRGDSTPLRQGYTKPFKKSGTVITMTLNMDQHELSFKVNDKEYGVVTDKLDKEKYRLAVILYSSDLIAELL